MATHYHAVVWIDHHEARVFHFNADAVVFNFDRHPNLDVSHMTPLPNGYVKRGRAVAEKRVVLAGLRLADRLKEALP